MPDDGPDAPLFGPSIPAMREAIQKDRGVLVPAPRIQPGDRLGQGDYAILFDEVTVAEGAVVLGRRYCPVPVERLVARGVPREAVQEDPNPRTGGPGCWVRPEDAETLAGRGLEVWPEELNYVVEHLGAALRDHLGSFLGIQEVHNLLEEWEERNRRFAPVVQQILFEPLWRLRFSRILRALVSARVPIGDWTVILAVVREKGWPGDPDAAAAVLQALRDQLGSAS